MDKVHSATRPAWALHRVEVLITLALAISLSAATTTLFSGWIIEKLAPHLAAREISEPMAKFIVDTTITVVLTFTGLSILPIYKKLKTYRYPSTYLYCFERTDYMLDDLGRTKENKVFVVGGLWLQTLNNGGILAKGIAYDWRGRAIAPNSQMRWESKHVGTTEEPGKVTCFIIFDVDQADVDKRPYKEGLISFSKKTKEEGIVAKGTVYRGHIHGIDPPNDKIHFYARAYAERVGKEFSEEEIQDTLRKYGEILITSWRRSE